MESSQSSAPTPSPLDYGPKIPFYRRRTVWRLAIIALVISAVLWSAKGIPSLWHAARIYYLQRQCLAHPITPGIAVCASGPPPICVTSAESARLFAELPRLGSDPNEGRNTFGNAPVTTVYLGIRRAPDGVALFIAVYAAIVPSGNQTRVSFLAFYRPITLTEEASGDEGINYFLNGSSLSGRQPQVTIYSGVEDPANASRFTFTFALGAERTVMDCQIRSDDKFYMNDPSSPSPY